MLFFSLLSFPASAWGNSAHPDWERIEQARQHLARHNFAGALDALDEVNPDGEASEVANKVRKQVDEAMAGRIEVEATGFADTQPLRWSRFQARGRGWLTPSLQLGLEGTSLLIEAPLPATPGAPSTPRGQVQAAASLGVSLFGANLWLDPEVALARWSDAAFVLLGQIGAEARWLSPLRVSVRAARDQVTVTEASIQNHILSDSGTASIRLHDWDGFYAELLYRRSNYSDNNTEDAAHWWLLVPFVREKFRLSGGYDGSYSDSLENRWDFTAQRYTPYFSPLDQWRHGLIVSVGRSLGRLSLDLKGTVSWVDELDPNSEVWSVRARRRWLYGNFETALGVDLPFCLIKASYQYEHQIYYHYHQASLSFDVPLQRDTGR